MSVAREKGVFENDQVDQLPIVEQDILDEFLDQRVYESFSNAHGGLESDLMDNYYGGKQYNTGLDHVSPSFKLESARTPSEDSFGQHRHSSYTTPNYLSFTGSPAEVRTPKLENGQHQIMQEIHSEGNVNEGYFQNFQQMRSELSKLKFGDLKHDPCPKSIEIPDISYLNFSPEVMSRLPYTLQLSTLPSHSRVETQVKLTFTISPPPPQMLLHIPHDVVSKGKLCLSEPVESLPESIKQNLLYLDTYVLNSSNINKSCNICPRCIRREQKRASRRKVGTDLEETNADMYISNQKSSCNPNPWANEKMMKKAVIFNCKEIVSFPPPSGFQNDSGKSLDLSARIICYCRHHNESVGFKLLFVIKNAKGQVVAKQISTPIMIMDRKKNTTASNRVNSVKLESSPTNGYGATNLDSMSYNGTSDLGIQQLSPSSISESFSENLTNTDTDGRSLKKKKLSVDDSLNTNTNPMFNGGVNGYSPLSNSDTNGSASNRFIKPMGTPGINRTGSINLSIAVISQPNASANGSANSNMPTIQRVIPAQGPLRGGIEVTLLGFNFRPGLQAKFGTNLALSTHFWSESTIVTYLPPAAQPGQVLVSLESQDRAVTSGVQQQIFTYTDDTDKQLIELALQIVGLKMNGKLEEAKSIAKRIVGTDSSAGSNSGTYMDTSTSDNSPNCKSASELSDQWYGYVHKAVVLLTRSDFATEDVLIDFLLLVDLPNCPIMIPNWQLCNEQGQTLLHLAVLKGYKHLIAFLINHGCKVDELDNQGLTPLFMASLCGDRGVIKLLIDRKANWTTKLPNNKYIRDYCDLNVLDIFSSLETYERAEVHARNEEELERSTSLDSLSSLFTLSYGRRISKMVFSKELLVESGEKGNEGAISNYYDDDSPELADSEYDSNEDDDYDSDTIVSRLRNNIPLMAAQPGDMSASSQNTEESGNKSTSKDGGRKRGGSFWSKVKKAFQTDDENDSLLPTYDDLFPFGPSNSRYSSKTPIEKPPNSSTLAFTPTALNIDDLVSSDSSEDLILPHIHSPSKLIANDKMLLFFWFPALIAVLGLFIYISVMGYELQFVENLKSIIRQSIGNFVLGKDRIALAFKNNPKVEKVFQRMISHEAQAALT